MLFSDWVDKQQTAMLHVLQNPKLFPTCLVFYLDEEYFKYNLHYIVLLSIPKVSAQDIAQRYKKFGDIGHVLRMRRGTCPGNAPCCYAYIGYESITSVVAAVHQGKFWNGHFMDPRISRWAYPDETVPQLFSTSLPPHADPAGSFCEDAVVPQHDEQRLYRD